LDRLLKVEAVTPEVYARRVAQLREELNKPVKRGGLSAAAKELEESLRRQAGAYQDVLSAGLAAEQALRTPVEDQIAQYREAKFALEEWGREFPNMAERAQAALARLETEGLEDIQITAERIFPPKEQEKLNTFWEQAARNSQDIFADFLYDPFKDGLDGMIASFGDMLRQMAAQAVAAQIASKIFGSAAGGTGTGILGTIGSFFGFAGGGYTGEGGTHEPAGVVHRGEWVMPKARVQEPGAKQFLNSFQRYGMDFLSTLPLPGYATGGFVGGSVGTISSAGMAAISNSTVRNDAMNVTQTFMLEAPQGTVSRATQQQVAAKAAQGLAQANRRNN
jgi:hypothetical protein